MNNTTSNKRKYERFDLELPAKVIAGDEDITLNINTRDISAGGAFFEIAEPLDMGEKLTIEIVITNETLEKLTGTQPKISVRGTVTRSEPAGMAVSFSGHEQIMPVSMMDN